MWLCSSVYFHQDETRVFFFCSIWLLNLFIYFANCVLFFVISLEGISYCKKVKQHSRLSINLRQLGLSEKGHNTGRCNTWHSTRWWTRWWRWPRRWQSLGAHSSHSFQGQSPETVPNIAHFYFHRLIFEWKGFQRKRQLTWKAGMVLSIRASVETMTKPMEMTAITWHTFFKPNILILGGGMWI